MKKHLILFFCIFYFNVLVGQNISRFNKEYKAPMLPSNAAESLNILQKNKIESVDSTVITTNLSSAHTQEIILNFSVKTKRLYMKSTEIKNDKDFIIEELYTDKEFLTSGVHTGYFSEPYQKNLMYPYIVFDWIFQNTSSFVFNNNSNNWFIINENLMSISKFIDLLNHKRLEFAKLNDMISVARVTEVSESLIKFLKSNDSTFELNFEGLFIFIKRDNQLITELKITTDEYIFELKNEYNKFNSKVLPNTIQKHINYNNELNEFGFVFIDSNKIKFNKNWSKYLYNVKIFKDIEDTQIKAINGIDISKISSIKLEKYLENEVLLKIEFFNNKIYTFRKLTNGELTSVIMAEKKSFDPELFWQ